MSNRVRVLGGYPTRGSMANSTLLRRLFRRFPIRGSRRFLIRSHANWSSREALALPELTCESIFGDSFLVDRRSWLEWYIWFFGFYESHVTSVLQREIKPGAICIDVGANIGVHAIRMAKLVGPSGHVVAIEADPSLAERLERNLELNAIANARIVTAAAAEHSGDSFMLFRPSSDHPNRGMASLVDKGYPGGDSIRVESMAIDELSLPRVDLIKIDVEGAEEGVLRGATRTISKHRPVLIVEATTNAGARAELMACLDEYSYDVNALLPTRPIAGRGKDRIKPLRKVASRRVAELFATPRRGPSQRVSVAGRG